MSAPAVRSMDRRGKPRWQYPPSFICLCSVVIPRSSKVMSTLQIPIRAEQAIKPGHVILYRTGFYSRFDARKNSAMVPGPECAPMTGST